MLHRSISSNGLFSARYFGVYAFGEDVAALQAEASLLGQLCATGATDEREEGAAAETEPRVDRVVLLTPRTLHAGASQRAGPEAVE